jgi:ketosteroid isomerase-like protein
MKRATPTRILFASLYCICLSSLFAQTSSHTCTSPEHRQFDFWIGNWDVFDTGGSTPVAHARIDSILDGCVLREDYRGIDGHVGQSFTIYDNHRKLWHQTWVTNRGELLEIDGNMEQGKIVLNGKNQRGELVRGTWAPAGEDVHEVAAISADSGNNWKPWFDIVFRKTSEKAGVDTAGTNRDSKRDEEIVAGLDSEYQKAVKYNDALTMSRILADDFVLVTSSGKTFSKSELLEEAKSRRITYEGQEDSEKSVRVWGDTAIVTANLWEKGIENGKPFEHRLWFSDVYRRTQDGWRYVFAQSAYRPCEIAP